MAKAIVDANAQAEKTFHFHGYFERYLRAVHRGVSAYVFVLPILRSTFFFWR
jgi:hypothetical protein